MNVSSISALQFKTSFEQRGVNVTSRITQAIISFTYIVHNRISYVGERSAVRQEIL